MVEAEPVAQTVELAKVGEAALDVAVEEEERSGRRRSPYLVAHSRMEDLLAALYLGGQYQHPS